MPRIDDASTDIAIYLYQTPRDAEEGADIGGSGFLVGLPMDTERSWIIAVTNRHVIEDGAAIVRLNNKAGSSTVLDVPERDWIFHPDGQDLAVAPIRVNEHHQRFRFLPAEGFLSRERALELDIGLGTDTLMVGRFIGRDGKQTNVPTVRFGHIAQMPTLVSNRDHTPQESFLVETRSIGGYSGSPVFAYRLPFQAKVGAAERVDNSYWGPTLLGVDWGHTGQADPVFDATGRETEMYVESNTGLSLVIPAWRLRELLEGESLRSRLRDASPQEYRGETDFTMHPSLRIWPD